MDDLIAFITARLDNAETKARDLLRTAQDVGLALQEPHLLGREIPGWHSWPDVETMCEGALRDVESARRILARHRDCVPWGNGPCEHAGITGEPPCPDLRDLLWRWSEHLDYDPAWTPARTEKEEGA
jgi:hypothetical protein